MQSNSSVNRFTDKMSRLFNQKINEINDLYSGSKISKSAKAESDKIVFVLPLSGRYETFLRFLNNFEDVSDYYDKNELSELD